MKVLRARQSFENNALQDPLATTRDELRRFDDLIAPGARIALACAAVAASKT
jgi:hypothetical protein